MEIESMEAVAGATAEAGVAVAAQENVSGGAEGSAVGGAVAGTARSEDGSAGVGGGAEASERAFADRGSPNGGTDSGTEGTAAGGGAEDTKPEGGKAGSAAGGTQAPEQSREQSSAERAENARKRRERERAQELEDARTEARAAAIMEMLGGVNPYTKTAMKDVHDVAEYERMKRIEAAGGDPLQEYAKQVAEEARRAEADRAQATAREKWVADDREAFIAAYPRVNLDAVLDDADFRAYADGKVGRVPMADIYRGYTDLMERANREAEERAAQRVANAKASPGSASGVGVAEQEFFTRAQVLAMSPAEVHKNYEKIIASQAKW